MSAPPATEAFAELTKYGNTKEARVLRLAVLLVALATLFFLTAVALGSAGRVHHPYRVVAVLASALILGIALLYEYGAAD